MRKLAITLATVSLLVGLSYATALAVKAKAAPESATIDDCKAKQAAVVFPHKKHIDSKIACDKCHHTQKGLTATSNDEVPTCNSCHVKPEKAGTPMCSEMSMKKNPFHIACVSCHKAQAKGPTGCKDCHKK